MRNALESRRDMKIGCAVSHMDEITLDLCLASLRAQTVPFNVFKLVAGETPMCASFNASLDFAWQVGCDVLFHTASDVIAHPRALEELLAVLDLDAHYLSVGKGFDILHGPHASVGLWAFNMRIIQDKYRFQDEFLQDIKLCARIEQETKKSRIYPNKCLQLGYHHPIWTAKDIFMKFRYSTMKYNLEYAHRCVRFLAHELRLDPDNKVLQIGIETISSALNERTSLRSKDYSALSVEFDTFQTKYDLDGTEFYVIHEPFNHHARSLLQSTHDCFTYERRHTLGQNFHDMSSISVPPIVLKYIPETVIVDLKARAQRILRRFE